MDTIWDRNPSKSEVIGRCGRDERDEKTNDHAEPTKVKINTRKGNKYAQMPVDCLRALKLVTLGLFFLCTLILLEVELMDSE